jgi:hypothetical protein
MWDSEIRSGSKWSATGCCSTTLGTFPATSVSGPKRWECWHYWISTSQCWAAGGYLCALVFLTWQCGGHYVVKDLYPYNVQHIQHLDPVDYSWQFCCCINMHLELYLFYSLMELTLLIMEWIIHVTYIWLEVNPHKLTEGNFQCWFSVTISLHLMFSKAKWIVSSFDEVVLYVHSTQWNSSMLQFACHMPS